MKLLEKSILVVEDELMLAMMLEDHLGDLGARVVGPASTVSKALELIECEAIDAAVLDVNLRGERSDQVAAALKARGIPYVCATGYGAAEGEPDADVVTLRKPYSLSQIEDALIAALVRDAARPVG